MKFKILVRLIEKLLHIAPHGDEPRADMYLHDFLLAFGIVLGLVAIGLGIAFIFFLHIALIIFSIIFAVICVLAALCWRNQTIHIIDDKSFEYSTFLGNKKVYDFEDIRSLRVNSDSRTLIMRNGKIHIESIAILSDRLVNKINEHL